MKKLLLITSAVLALTTQANVMAADNTKTTVGQKIDDAKIVTSINAELVKDNELSALKINVDSTQGRVVLKGNAPNYAAKERAADLAKSVTGVVGVDNRLTISDKKVSDSVNTTYENTKDKANHAAHEAKEDVKKGAHTVGAKMDDASINVAVNSGLAADDELSALKINVDVTNGRVLLKGTAPSMSAKNRATDIAKKVEGVASVNNQLVVKK